MEASCIAGKEGGVGVYSPELEREKEREREKLGPPQLNAPLPKKGFPWTLLFFPFFYQKLCLLSSPSKGAPSSRSGKSKQPRFFFLRKTSTLSLFLPLSQPKNSPLFP